MFSFTTVLFTVLIKFGEGHIHKVVTKYCVEDFQVFSQVRLDIKCLLIWGAKFGLPADFNLHHFHFVFDCSSWYVEGLCIQFFSTQDHEFSQPFTTSHSFEHVSPICTAVDFVSAHSVYIDYVDELSHFVNKNKRANATEVLAQFFGQNDQIISADRS